MVKPFRQMISLICTFCVVLHGLVGCSGQAPYDADGNVLVEAQPAATQELVIYVPPEYFITEAMKVAKDKFMATFPDVHLVFRTFSSNPKYDPMLAEQTEEYQTFKELLQTEMTAGKGPDLVIFGDKDFPDINKMLKTGAFCNLDHFISADESFDLANFQQSVINCGVRDGQRLFVPLHYVHYTLGTTDEAMQKFDFSLSETPTFEEWSKQIIDYTQLHSIDENRTLFYEWDGFDLHERLFINSCGLSILDYDTEEINIDSENFRQYMEFYKAIYPCLIQSWDGTVPQKYYTNVDIMSALNEFDLLFFIGETGQWAIRYLFTYFQEMQSSATPQFYPMPTLSGQEPYARPGYRAAIRNNSPNQVNAYEFLKILLSLDVQCKLSIPVNNQALLYNQIEYKGWGYTQKELDDMYQFLTHLDCRESNATAVIDIVHTAMLPWIEDQRSYEDCLAELESQLELYIHE